ncbi:YeeE/YedE family protein [Sediminimonas sp.]|uniref:YeeE/YedE family protein n=1 Tax=Sediminimonas sp. TaxID=2823379 RepID=UPI0025FB1391|nr:YeeE/YedE family protein [Sediminimonas sp.]
MYDWIGDNTLVALIGLLSGVALGMAARLGRFCTMGAIEDLLYGNSAIRMRMWILVIGLSVIGAFGLMAAGLFEPEMSFYLSLRWFPLMSVVGGLMFGYGMALSGNCGFGHIARIGGGDIRSMVIVLVMGVAAYFVMSGPLAPLRAAIVNEQDVINETPPGFAHLIASVTSLSVPMVGLGLGGLITLAALASRSFLAERGAIFWSAVVAVGITAGWAGSYWVATSGFAAMPVVSHSFSAPVGESLLYVMTGSARAPSFAVGSVAGVALGGFLGSLIKGHFRWEACEDPRELRRQLTGAALMGVGAVLALGCSIGQGVTAFSVLAFSAPVTFAAIVAGAALGLRQLIEGFQPAE